MRLLPLAFGLLLTWSAAAPAFAQQPIPPLPSTALVEAGTTSVRELAAVIAERDRQYAQRFEAQQKAVDAALAAQDKATAAAFSAAEKAVAAALAAQEKATSAAFLAANSAVAKAEMANEKRLDSVNEFRAQLKDQANTLATRSEVNVQLKSVQDKIDIVSADQMSTRARSEGASNLWTLIAGVIGIIAGILVAAVTIFRRAAAGVPPPLAPLPATVRDLPVVVRREE